MAIHGGEKKRAAFPKLEGKNPNEEGFDQAGTYGRRFKDEQKQRDILRSQTRCPILCSCYLWIGVFLTVHGTITEIVTELT